MTKHDEVLRFYTDFAETYDAVIHRDKDYTAFERVPSWLVERLSAGASIVDLGCGTGLSASSLIKQGHRVIGVDVTPNMLEKAGHVGYAELICRSIDEPLPFSTAQFDAALLIGVMEFIQRPHALFKEIKRIVRIGGKVACTIPEKLPADLEKHIGIRTYSLEAIEALFRHMGLSIERKERFQGFISQGETVSYAGYLLTVGSFTPIEEPLASSLFIVRESPGKGRGVFTTQDIPQGRWIERAPLLVLSATEYSQISPTLLYHYAYDWGPQGKEAALALGLGSLYNHSYQPNIYYLRREEEQSLDFFALRDIKAGEELCSNYNGEPSCQDPVWFEQESLSKNDKN